MKQPEAAASGIPFGTSGIPFGASGIPFGASGIPFGASGIPFTTKGIPFRTKGIPFTTKGIPFRTKGIPFRTKGIPFATSDRRRLFHKLPAKRLESRQRPLTGAYQDTYGTVGDGGCFISFLQSGLKAGKDRLQARIRTLMKQPEAVPPPPAGRRRKRVSTNKINRYIL
ncbi:MAG: hypothetical protein LBD24_03735 [Spirochaetaceae bacterium]|nr:hypothetical protein [Spirochaetaceae bacterium]